MTVRTSANITWGDGDFTRTDRGVTWGIKVTTTGDWSFVCVFVRTDGVWSIDGIPESQLDADFNESMKTYGGDVMAWYHGKLIPSLNRWLKLLPSETIPHPSENLAEQADAIIQGITITEMPDGTLVAI